MNLCKNLAGWPGILHSVLLLVLVAIVPGPALAEYTVSTVESYLEQSRAAGKTANRLINELSPYLLQHAYNPVQWYAWGEEAFARAKSENKPIFLSIGYSTCHWCHVMARESFENKAIASILNQHFISIKLDREERPDIDAVYMSATQLLNGHGGWPMTVFINHKLEPFHAGTYYPPESLDGRRGLKEILNEVHRLWVQERSRVDTVAGNIAAMIAMAESNKLPAVTLDKNIRQRALQQINLTFDEEHGGFGQAPKFPQHGIFAFLLAQSRQNNDDADTARSMISVTLTAMAQGGIFDQIGGGFHRYAVDAEWQVPHFEKMLYSQALLATAYAQLYTIDAKPLYENVTRATLDFVMREMQSKQGGFYSALDADSERPGQPGEHAEGAYYLWSKNELKKLLTEKELAFAERYFAIDEAGNIASDPQDEFRELNILYVSDQFKSLSLTEKQQALLNAIKVKLFSKRQHRPRPNLDDKIITAWNGMMIAAFVEAYDVYGDKKYLDVALRAAEFIHDQLINAKGELLRRYRNRQAGIEAGLSDYVWYIHSLIKLYKTTKDSRWLNRALNLSQKQHALFFDADEGGYFETTGNDKSLLFRTKNIVDGALPAANAVAVSSLNDLYGITKDKKWQTYADRTRSAFSAEINNSPVAAAMFLSTAEE